MSETKTQDRSAVYEIGYLLAGLPEEKVADGAAQVMGVVTKAGASIIAEEAPKHEHLAYTMRKKTVSGAYEKYDSAYFGWVKFEITPDAIDGIKKTIEALPPVLRMLVITTTKENTYLGKRASIIAQGLTKRTQGEEGTEPVATAEKAAPASIEEMDKSIDEMVKEA